ncbi:MAG: 4-(cytidine 5'-diphospho)-2-C-methyl-D-erythritol kinase, partial [Paramuribaculum sp.]|nr:4-(cytidine 5'-diphospho)-2-C-methyl-D-erythritol kinase [Paramuribaculum sp.]
MIVFPNAKINIGLNIIEKRPDGYHNIESVMYPVPWTDILEIVPASGTETRLTTSGRAVACPPEKNLVMKAFRALDKRVPLPPVDIFLHKVIPDGAGLGGGSSDAAFTLSLLNDLFNLDLTKDFLAETAAEIGADCPFFIYNRPMLATGTGTDLSEINFSLKGYRIVIVKPPVSVPTAKAYAGVVPMPATSSILELIGAFYPEIWTDKVVNDFEKSVFAEFPEIGMIKDTLYNIGAFYASMSGSG